MSSLYDDLCEKLKKDPRLTKRGGPRFDINLLLFNARDSLRELWEAADTNLIEARRVGRHPSERLEAIVEKLRPIFGERARDRFLSNFDEVVKSQDLPHKSHKAQNKT